MSIDLVILDEEQQLELSRIAQSRSLPAGYVFRAKLILMLAEGASFSAIKQRLGTTAPTIIRWKRRFVADGLDGLDTSHPGQPASVLTPKLRARILSATRRQPKDGSTHWSCRKLAAELDVSKDAVHRVWKEAGLKPHRLERYMASDDPDFETKAADIIGLYLNPPQHAAVFCVDEKTAIQALDRLATGMERSPYMLRWIRPRAVSMARPPHVTPVRTSSPFWRKLLPSARAASRSISSSTICQLTRPNWCSSFWSRIPAYPSTSPQPIPLGSTRLNSGSPRSSVT